MFRTWMSIMTEERFSRVSKLESIYPDKIKYTAGAKPWNYPCDIAYPSATQNEINAEDA